ncbi:nuclear transport factor 2 family protein [Pseudomonas capsici]|uniref:nuclear transport factor 2 family protein n=1 Tax=Pseudomonas capsici TaxID=2810614 RepID=UPI0019103DBB|nr:nuclear transport factor 2 family protein [Pseudomonas capsici]MBX8612372.1 nuclear transport factor 2 family protein [Pseudomonas cichorii]MCV4286806.1 nuclear transport factor 2 family protein [Pseudomonas capsici]GFM70519.1 hypothetical protein PSCICL_15110 [Pseudomonas cichorii]
MFEAEIRKLLDIEAIRSLRIKYAHYLDANKIDDLTLLFTPDAICVAGQGQWNGREQLRKGLVEAFTAYDKHNHGSYPFHHAITNHWVEILDENTAQGRCYLLDLSTAGNHEDTPWILLGSYADEYRKIDGQWYISRSHLDITWPERHIGGGLPGQDLVLPGN